MLSSWPSALNEAVEGDVVCFLDAHGGPDVTKLEKVTKKNLPDIKFLIKRSRAYVTLPLIGQDTVLDGQAGDEIRRDLEEEGMRIEDFAMAAMPDLASAGLRREILLRASPSIISFNGNAQCKFYLPRGSYATTVLREYMKVAPEHMD
jgi:tRNA pseudouridine13 synthase